MTAKKISKHVMTRRFLLPASVAVLIIAGASALAWTAMGIWVNPNDGSSPFYAKYKKTVFIEYPEDGQIHDQLSGQNWQVAGSADSSNPGVQDLMDQVNLDLLDSESQASVSDLEVSYQIHLKPFIDNTVIDYIIVLKGSMSNLGEINSQRELIDRGWRGFSVHDEVVIDGVEINMPIGILESHLPETYGLLAGTKADKVLLQPTINADFILEQSIADWRFHREVKNPQPDPWPDLGYVPISFNHYWTLGELEPVKGHSRMDTYTAIVTLDRAYTIESTQPETWGIGMLGGLDGLHVIGVILGPDNLDVVGVILWTASSLQNAGPDGVHIIGIMFGLLHVLGSDVFTVSIAGIAVIAGIAFFLARRRSCMKQRPSACE